MRNCNLKSPPPRKGMVLVLVLVVIVLLSLAGYTFTNLMFTERKGADAAGRQAQALAAADSGVQWVRIFLGKDAETQLGAGGWYDNYDAFRGVVVADDVNPKHRARFTLVAPVLEDGRPTDGVRYGLEDESGRLNLNAVLLADKYDPDSGARKMLMGLPGMTEQIADAILDWIDTDDETREYGAEADYYSAQQPPYSPKNGPLQSIEELLLVRGVTPALLFGSDWNRNGRADADEPDPQDLPGVDNYDGSMNQGWSAYLTLHSAESNLRPDGSARINLNQEDMKTLYDDLNSALGEEEATFIVAYRQNGPYEGNDEGEEASGELDLEKKGSQKIASVLDLIGAKVQTTFKDDNKPTVLKSPFTEYMHGEMGVYLPDLMDNVTVDAATVAVGRINVNQASRAVLAGVPGMTEEILEEIMSQREPDPLEADDSRRHETWLLQEGIVDLDEMKKMSPFLCGGGNVYRAQVIGYYDGGGPAVRLETVIDATNSPPRVLFWRDISQLGRGFALETLGIAAPE
ncbi:MAG: general secretion pathway protein GspK [Pirellulales bacterium]|nr:general secretion pathway protein GspK [Pirellulales bacterium]